MTQREHAGLLRAAVGGGEVVAWEHGLTVEGQRMPRLSYDEKQPFGEYNVDHGGTVDSRPLYAFPTAAVSVAALRELVEKFDGWVRELAEDPDASNAIEGQAIQACRAELAALIRKEA